MTITITGMDIDAAGLRAAATRAKDVAASRRMLALAMVLDRHLSLRRCHDDSRATGLHLAGHHFACARRVAAMSAMARSR